MNFYEELVHHYLTEELELPTLPNLEVTHDESGKPWRAQVDFLSLDFAAKKIYLVEVTGRRDFPDYFSNRLNGDRKTIEWYAQSEILKGQMSEGYSIEWWLFVRDEHVTRLRDLLKGCPVEVKRLQILTENLP